MTTAHATRPDTVMGRALSARAIALTDALSTGIDVGSSTVVVGNAGDAGVAPTDRVDLITPEATNIPLQVREAAEAALDR
ncbi:MAG: hypothetical protein ACRDJC_13145, partial [Thermomicrobiales bacterium]